MRILYIRRLFQKNRGFTLIELMLVLAISSIIMVPTCSILKLSIKTCEIGEQRDELMLNGRHAIEYIKNEIKSADMIVAQKKIRALNIKYPTNIGFLLVYFEKNDIYEYVTYHTEDGDLIRVTCRIGKERYPSYSSFTGNNVVSKLTDSISNTRLDTENNMIYLDFDLKSDSDEEQKLNLKSDIYIRCRTDF